MKDDSFRLAIDVGGTFTDVVLLDEISRRVWFAKVLSTPDDPSVGSLNGARAVMDTRRVDGKAIRDVVHATTVATNAILEGKGACTGLITTSGFRDILEMGREARYDIYDLGIQLPPPIVPRRRRLEVDERLNHDGTVLTALKDDDAIAVIRQLVDELGVQSLAICLLHGYTHHEHERRIADLATALFPDVPVSVSHEVSAEIREFERFSTTVVDAAVKPLVRNYVKRLSGGLKEIGVGREVAMMLSHGGIGAASEVAQRFPVRMIESGPAAGTIAAAHFARQALDRANAIALDMGGTTAKISVIEDGEPSTTREFEVGQIRRFKSGSGYPLQISAIELLEIGAGGGSLAHLNQLGLLAVGPQSAGADPGPACYGSGGTHPTVTDADLLLGYLDPAHFLSGGMELDKQAATDAIHRVIARPLNMSVSEVAWGIHDVVNERMAAATRAHAAEKGIDLREFAMIAFGGAGPVHAYALSRKLGLRRVICPFGAGVASAIGCLAAPPAVDVVTPYFEALDDLDWVAVNQHFQRMRRSGEASLATLIGEQADLSMQCSVDLRCQGQGYDVTVPLARGEGGSDSESLRTGFAGRYLDLYGHAPPAVGLEVVALRARILEPRPEFVLTSRDDISVDSTAMALKTHRDVYFESERGFVSTAVYDRYRLKSGVTYPGPAVIEERETSIVTGPDTCFHVDEGANIIIDFAE